MDTLPMPLDKLAQARGGLSDYRITAPAQIRTMLHALLEGSVPLAINGPDGATVGATLWTIDADRGVISLSATPGDPHLQQIVQADEAVVVGYLDKVKLQFDAHELMLVHGGRRSALSCAYPSELFRFQRRDCFRVRPVLRSAPVARLFHPDDARIELALRILDVSLGGCALLLPDDLPSIEPGTMLRDVVLDFDAETRFSATLLLHHLSKMNSEAIGMRMGCELVKLPAAAERMLQLYIDQTQKKRRLMAVE